MLFQGLTNRCGKCERFYYTLQLHIDLNNYILAGVYLNSETIAVDDKKGTIHRIKNVYSTKETEYAYYPKGERVYLDGAHVGRKSITIPLISLDVDKPEKTIERLKTLIVFS
jgi:hypothetical protein